MHMWEMLQQNESNDTQWKKKEEMAEQLFLKNNAFGILDHIPFLYSKVQVMCRYVLTKLCVGCACAPLG